MGADPPNPQMSVNRRFRLILGIRKIHHSQKYVVQHTKKFAGIKKKLYLCSMKRLIKFLVFAVIAWLIALTITLITYYIVENLQV